MKKSDLKRFRENLASASTPPKSKKIEDVSDELSNLFDTGASLRGDLPPATLPSQTTPTSQTSHTQNVEQLPVAPARDFSRVANSIARIAVPAGLFRGGKSKQLYDCLYSLTRGALVPSRTVRISRPKLMKKARIGARVTFDANVERLQAAGLIEVRRIAGEHEGNEYTVFLPEEISMTSQSSMTSQTSDTSHAQNPDVLVGLDSSQTRHTLNDDSAAISSRPNTSFKTKINTDDEALALSDLISIFTDATQKLTGRAPRASDRKQWADLGRVLVEELNDAAARAESISSVPAFLAAHLRRKLAPKPVARKREGNQKPDVGLPSVPPPDPDRRLMPEEIEEQARVIAEVIEGGYTIGQAEAQFGGSFHEEDWTMIRSIVMAQAAPKKGA